MVWLVSTALRSTTTSRALLRRMLDEPELPELVRALSPAELGRVIAHVGLEDSSELLRFASTAQLERLIDDDVFRAPAPGHDETLDGDRFVVWLEVMLECGEGWAADRLVELDPDFLTLALARQLIVVGVEDLGHYLTPGDEASDLLEKVLGDRPSEELEEFVVIARQHDGWDALLGVLLALDERHHEFLQRLLGRIQRLSAEHIEETGSLYDVLSDLDALEQDVLGERELRRAEHGYISGARGGHFLELAWCTRPEEVYASREDDVVTRAYFRELGVAREARSGRRAAARAHVGAGGAPPDGAGGPAPLAPVLLAAGVTAEPLDPGVNEAAHARGRELTVQRGMERLREQDEGLYARRLEELAYLTNVLLAGATVDGRPLRSAEAAEAALALCNIGLEYALRFVPGPLAARYAQSACVAVLRDQSAPRLYRAGAYVVRHELAIPAARALLALPIRPTPPLDELTAIEATRAALRRAVEAGEIGAIAAAASELAGACADVQSASAVLRMIEHCPRSPRPRGAVASSLGAVEDARRELDALVRAAG